MTENVSASNASAASFCPENVRHVECCVHENGVYELIFKDNSNAAIDEWVIFQLRLIKRQASIPNRQPILELLDVSVGTPAVTYVMSKARQLLNEAPSNYPYRVVVLHPNRQGAIVQVFWSLINSLRLGAVRVRFYPSERRPGALVWLLAVEP